MAEGKTINMTAEMMDKVITAIKKYREVADAEYKNVNTAVTSLVGKGFQGSAANGYLSFYTSNVEPAIGKSLTGVLDTFENICNTIKKGIPDDGGVDEQLGAENERK